MYCRKHDKHFAVSCPSCTWEATQRIAAPPAISIQTDKERLDFMDQCAIDVKEITGEEVPEDQRAVVFFAPYSDGRPQTIREAIDKAMKEANSND